MRSILCSYHAIVKADTREELGVPHIIGSYLLVRSIWMNLGKIDSKLKDEIHKEIINEYIRNMSNIRK